MPPILTSSSNTAGALGIFGGTFDPIHTAHLKLAEEAQRQLQLSGILWIPAGNPPHRPPPTASATDRLAMLRLALADHPDWQIDDAEVMSSAPSYTIHTLERLRDQRDEKRPLVLLMGTDAFLGLTTWHRWQDILQLAHIGVASRPDCDLTLAPNVPHTPFMLSAGTVSSTAIRTALRQGETPALPSSVLDYIRIHHLYIRKP